MTYFGIWPVHAIVIVQSGQKFFRNNIFFFKIKYNSFKGNTIIPEDQQIFLDAAKASTESHKIAWDAAIEEAINEASTTMCVEFVNDVDKDAFREATSGMIEDYCEEYPGVQKLLDIIDSVK